MISGYRVHPSNNNNYVYSGAPCHNRPQTPRTNHSTTVYKGVLCHNRPHTLGLIIVPLFIYMYIYICIYR